MKNILIVGATGSVVQVARKLFLEQTQDQLTLFSRNAHCLKTLDDQREKVFAGSVLNPTELDEAMRGQDVVFASLSSDLNKMAEAIVASMKRVGVKKIVFISSMGIYNIIPASLGSAGNCKAARCCRIIAMQPM